jgi:hypothetical protein
MAYVFITSECFGCGQTFSYHPNKVPSIYHQGARRPICAECVKRVNPMRIQNKLEPIVPMPGAYDAADESEINWT